MQQKEQQKETYEKAAIIVTGKEILPDSYKVYFAPEKDSQNSPQKILEIKGEFLENFGVNNNVGLYIITRPDSSRLRVIVPDEQREFQVLPEDLKRAGQYYDMREIVRDAENNYFMITNRGVYYFKNESSLEDVIKDQILFLVPKINEQNPYVIEYVDECYGLKRFDLEKKELTKIGYLPIPAKLAELGLLVNKGFFKLFKDDKSNNYIMLAKLEDRRVIERTVHEMTITSTSNYDYYVHFVLDNNLKIIDYSVKDRVNPNITSKDKKGLYHILYGVIVGIVGDNVFVDDDFLYITNGERLKDVSKESNLFLEEGSETFRSYLVKNFKLPNYVKYFGYRKARLVDKRSLSKLIKNFNKGNREDKNNKGKLNLFKSIKRFFNI
jgi:hypothetical protein